MPTQAEIAEGYQPQGTAPRDGREIEALWNNGCTESITHWEKGNDDYPWDGTNYAKSLRGWRYPWHDWESVPDKGQPIHVRGRDCDETVVYCCTRYHGVDRWMLHKTTGWHDCTLYYIPTHWRYALEDTAMDLRDCVNGLETAVKHEDDEMVSRIDGLTESVAALIERIDQQEGTQGNDTYVILERLEKLEQTCAGQDLQALMDSFERYLLTRAADLKAITERFEVLEEQVHAQAEIQLEHENNHSTCNVNADIVSELAEHVAALAGRLNTLEGRAAKLHKAEDDTGATWCPVCGPNVSVDEDGDCLDCGLCATGSGANRAVAALKAVEGMERALEEPDYKALLRNLVVATRTL